MFIIFQVKVFIKKPLVILIQPLELVNAWHTCPEVSDKYIQNIDSLMIGVGI